MNLSRQGREFYVQEIVTDPPVASWDASFDDGATWVTGTAVPGQANRWRWLLRGPDFNAANYTVAASTLVTADLLEPLLRATDAPEVVITSGTVIVLLH